jgi:hypothetical protein
MTFIINILRSLLLFTSLHLQNKNRFFDFPEVTGIEREETKKKKKEQQKLLLEKPWKRQRFRKEKLLKHQKSTRAKDTRFSNQQKLRRMYRNS